MATGIGEFDRVLGGGLVPGHVLLLSGEPGAGKSTLLLEVAHAVASTTGRTALYVSAEESVGQLALRARRISATSESLLLTDDTDLESIIAHIEGLRERLAFVVVDSVQTITSTEVEGRAGGVAQVMEVAGVLTRVAKSSGIPICLVGQVTKESVVAGPRALEHVVDTTLSLDGDRHTSLRLLRSVKNRFGAADDVACFEQTESGMVEVPDPSVHFRGHRESDVPGTCVTVTLAGRRALLAEVQALVAPSAIPNPRRVVSGMDSSRVAMLTAVTQRASGLRLADSDLFVATVGGIRINDPGADLALALAITSAGVGRALPGTIAAIGEVSLSGDVRGVPTIGRRVAEAQRLGFSHVLAPRGTIAALDGQRGAADVIEVDTLADGVAAISRLSGAPPGRPSGQAGLDRRQRDRRTPEAPCVC